LLKNAAFSGQPLPNSPLPKPWNTASLVVPARNIMEKPFKATGGARIGLMNATWPLASLSVTGEVIRLSVDFLGKYTFTPGQVVAISRYSAIPVLGWGIQIQHTCPDYPQHIVFWCLGDPDKLLAGIQATGFRAQAQPVELPPPKPWPIRWQAFLLMILVWNGLFMLAIFDFLVSAADRRSFPGPAGLLALGSLFVAALATLFYPPFQRFVLRPGRSVNEIRAPLNLILLISGTMFMGALCMLIFS
jgi:hypothetical protein